MNRSKLLLVCAVALGALLGAQVATATTVQKLTLHDLAKRSAGIAVARVEDAMSSWDAGHKEIYTFYTLRVLESVKGGQGQTTITLRQLGGVVDNIASIVPGMPDFRKGEEVVVFLTEKDRAGYPWVMGLQQGKYTISTDRHGVKMVRNDLSGTELVSETGGRVTSTVQRDLPLSSFLDGIKTSLDVAGKVQVDPTTPTE